MVSSVNSMHSISHIANSPSANESVQRKEFEEKFKIYKKEYVRKAQNFFNAYVPTLNTGIGYLSFLGAIGYWTGQINADIYRPIAMSSMLSSLMLKSANAVISSLDIDLLDEQGVKKRLDDFVLNVKRTETLARKIKEWKLNDYPKLLTAVIAATGLTIFGGGLGLIGMWIASEIKMCPELLLPCIAVSLTTATIQSFIDQARRTHDDAVLEDLRNERWGKYPSIEGFAKSAECAISRSLFRDIDADTKKAQVQMYIEKYESFENNILKPLVTSNKNEEESPVKK